MIASFKLILVGLALITFVNADDKSVSFDHLMDKIFVENQCTIPPKATKVAIWTMTRLRIGKQTVEDAVSFFNDYLKRYAESQCDAFDSVYLIWNNDQSPEYYGFTKNSKNWKKKVHFLHTEANNLDFRYIVPRWVEEDVLVNLDDDAVITCEGIKNALQQYNQRSIGSFGPIGGTLGRTVNFNKYINEFQNLPVYVYAQKTMNNYILPGLAILSKHTAELYYSQIFQFQKIREITTKLMNCEDIAANFMTNSLYDDIQSFFVKNMSGTLLSSNFELSHHPEFENERKRCGYWFTKIFGQNPNQMVYQVDKYEQKQKRTRVVQNNPCLTLTKKGIIENKYFTQKNYFLNLIGVYAYGVSQEIQQLLQKHNEVLKLSVEEKKRLVNTNKLDSEYQSKYSLEMLLSLKDEVAQGSSALGSFVKPVLPVILEKKLVDYQQILLELKKQFLKESSSAPFNQIDKMQVDIYRMKRITIILFALILATVLKIVWNVLEQKKDKNKSLKLQSHSFEDI